MFYYFHNIIIFFTQYHIMFYIDKYILDIFSIYGIFVTRDVDI
jgi:hypothetical protein